MIVQPKGRKEEDHPTISGTLHGTTDWNWYTDLDSVHYCPVHCTCRPKNVAFMNLKIRGCHAELQWIIWVNFLEWGSADLTCQCLSDVPILYVSNFISTGMALSSSFTWKYTLRSTQTIKIMLLMSWMGEGQKQNHAQHAPYLKTCCDYLNGSYMIIHICKGPTYTLSPSFFKRGTMKKKRKK